MRILPSKGATIYLLETNESPPDTSVVRFDANIFIKHPYLSPKLPVTYDTSEYLKKAEGVAEKESIDPRQHTGVVIVQSLHIIGQGANGSEYHKLHGCERQRLGIPTGERYDLCEGCNPKNHAEAKAIANAIKNGNKDRLKDTTAYLWGHWWCCEPCTTAMIDAGIKKVVLSKEFTSGFLHIS